jgi:hypothetical protein
MSHCWHTLSSCAHWRTKPAELLDVTPGDGPAATWTLDAVVTAKPEGGVDLKGPCASVRPPLIAWSAATE